MQVGRDGRPHWIKDEINSLAPGKLGGWQGLADAQYNLGILYAKGPGMPQDYVQAYMWFELSAAQGDQSQSAVSNRDAAARRMTPEQIAEAQKLAREWKPKPER